MKNPLERGLSKLSITAYSDRELIKKVGTITAMYNPATLLLNYQTDFAIDEFINSPKQNARYQQARPGGLALDLIFDARMPGNSVPVDLQLSKLRELCCTVDSKTKEPYFLKVQWGKLRWSGRGYFAGRLSSLSVQYSLFDRDAVPLRALASLNLTADESLVLQKNMDDLKAPKQSIVTVANMASLGLIAIAVGGTLLAENWDYLDIAFENNLNSLDDITAGQSLVVSNNRLEEGE